MLRINFVKSFFFVIIILLISMPYICIAADISVSASVDKKNVSVGDDILFTVHIEGTQAVTAPKLREIEGFRSHYLGPSTKISSANGETKIYVGHRYFLRAMKKGQFTIPALSIKHVSRIYKTKPIRVSVTTPGKVQKQEMTAADLKEYVWLDILVRKETAYINEGIPIAVRLYVRSGVSIQNISRRPELPSAGFSVIPLGEPVQRQTTINGVHHSVIDYSTTVYPVRSGELTLGPAQIECQAVIRPSSRRTGRTRRYALTVKSKPSVIKSNPLPTANQPKKFSGVVGKYKLDATAKPLALKVGEPITLTMTVNGTGNIEAVNIPEISDLSQFKLYDPQINVRKSGNVGIKTFEQVIIPKSADIEAIPEIRFNYFDPDKSEYVILTKGPIAVQVKPSDEDVSLQILDITDGKAVKREVLGRDIVYIKDAIGNTVNGDGRLYKSVGFLLLQAVPLIGLVGILVYQRRRERFATDKSYARQYHAPRKAKKGMAQAAELMASDHPQEFCSSIFKTMQEYLGDRLNLPSAGITIEIVASSQIQGFSEDILNRLTAFFQACDRLRFAQSEINEHEMAEILELARETIGLLEDSK